MVFVPESAAVAATTSQFGSLDALIHFAAIHSTKTWEEISADEFNRVLEVNVTGVFMGSKPAIRAMSPGRASGHGGSLINLSSIAGKAGIPAVTAYCASKGAVSLMTKSLAVECGLLKNGVRVNSIHPGVVWTDMGSALPQQLVDVGLAPDTDAARDVFLGSFDDALQRGCAVFIKNLNGQLLSPILGGVIWISRHAVSH